jgi:hypothetical protein
MLELRKNYPEWKKELYYYAGKVMYYEGFFIQDNKRSNNDWSIFHLTFDSEMIVSGLEFDNFPSGTNITGIPIGNEFIMKKVFSVLKDNSEEELKEGEGVSRKSLLALTMKKLIQPMHIKHSGYWLDLFEKLNITEEELIEYKQNFVEMLTAKNSTIISLGIKKLDFFIEKALVQPKEVITELGYILFNESKSTVEEAFSYLKKNS